MSDKPSSKDLLQQPIEDDDTKQLEGAQAIEEFLSNGSTEDAPPTDPEASPEDAALDQLAEQIRKTQRQLDLSMMSSEEKYKAVLKEEGISLEEAREIIDKVMVQLEAYVETRTIGLGVKIKLSTRMPADIERLRNVIEELQPRFQATREFEAAKYNLAASLVQYNNKVFNRDEKGILQIIEWLKKIPMPVFTAIQQELYEFDRKISIVFSDGYIENF